MHHSLIEQTLRREEFSGFGQGYEYHVNDPKKPKKKGAGRVILEFGLDREDSPFMQPPYEDAFRDMMLAQGVRMTDYAIKVYDFFPNGWAEEKNPFVRNGHERASLLLEKILADAKELGAAFVHGYTHRLLMQRFLRRKGFDTDPSLKNHFYHIL